MSKLVVNNIYQEPPTNEIDGLYYGKLTLGQISATYKHYLALTDIVINSRKYAVIMEDNVSFKDNIPDTMDKYLNQLPKILELIQLENNTKIAYLRLLGLGYFFKILFNRLAILGNFSYKFSDSIELLL